MLTMQLALLEDRMWVIFSEQFSPATPGVMLVSGHVGIER